MKIQPPVNPDWFSRNGRQYLEISEVPRAMNLPAHEVTYAVSLGDLHIDRLPGGKVVELAEMTRYIDLREANK